MMRFIIAFILSFLSFAASAQTTQILGAPGTRIATKGDMSVDSIFYLPRTLVTSRSPIQAGALRYQASDSALYQWTGTAWRKAGGGDVDTLLLSTRAWRQKGIDSVASVRIGGSGVTGYIPKFTAASTLDSSQIFQSNGLIGIGRNNPQGILDIQQNTSGDAMFRVFNNNTASGTGKTIMRFAHNRTTVPFGNQMQFTDSLAFIGTIAGDRTNGMTFFTGATSGSTDNERMRINPSGNIAIGTTADNGYRVNVSGTMRTTGATWLGTSASTLGVGTTTFTTGATGFGQILASGSNGGIVINSDSGNINRLFFTRKNSLNDNEGLIRYNTGSLAMEFWTAALQRMTIFGNGRIGVNTATDAGYQFDVAGDIRSTTGAQLATSSGGVGIGSPILSQFTTLDVRGALAATTVGTTDVISLIRNTQSGTWTQSASFKLGRYEQGMAAPRTRLDIALRDETENSSVNANTIVMTLNANKRVGINTTSPSSTLQIEGATDNLFFLRNTSVSGNINTGVRTVFAGHTGGALADFGYIYSLKENGSINSQTYMSFGTNDGTSLAERIRVSSAGNLGINTTSPSERLHVAGRIRATTIDSSSSPINMLWSDNNGVIRKTAVPSVGLSGGVNGRITRWTGASTLDTSSIFQNASGEIIVGGQVDQGSYVLQANGSISTNADINFGGDNLIMSNGRTFLNMGTSGTGRMYSQGSATAIQFYPNNTLQMSIEDGGEVWMGYSTDQGAFRLQVNGAALADGGYRSGAPNGGTAATWKLGIVVAGSYTAASNYLQVDVGGTLYYIGLVTPN